MAASEPLPIASSVLPQHMQHQQQQGGSGSDPNSAAGSPRAVALARTLTPNQLQRVQMLAQHTAAEQSGATGLGGDPESLLRASQGNLRTNSSIAARSLETEAMLQSAAYSNAGAMMGGLATQHHMRRGGPGGLPPLAYHPPYLPHPAAPPSTSGLLGNPVAYAEALASMTANFEMVLLSQTGGSATPAITAHAHQLAQQQLAQQLAAEQLASQQFAMQLAGLPTSALPGSAFMPLQQQIGQQIGRTSVSLPFQQQAGGVGHSMEGGIGIPPPPGPPSLHPEPSLMQHAGSGMPSGGSIVSNISSRMEPSVVGSPKPKSPPAAASPKPPLPKVLSFGKLADGQVRTPTMTLVLCFECACTELGLALLAGRSSVCPSHPAPHLAHMEPTVPYPRAMQPSTSAYLLASYPCRLMPLTDQGHHQRRRALREDQGRDGVPGRRDAADAADAARDPRGRAGGPGPLRRAWRSEHHLRGVRQLHELGAPTDASDSAFAWVMPSITCNDEQI